MDREAINQIKKNQNKERQEKKTKKVFITTKTARTVEKEQM
jgi:hypothetical protein